MKTARIIAVLLLLPASSVAQRGYCAYHALTDTFTCQSTCTSDGGCVGCCTIKVENNGEVCWVGGCCLYNPQSGGLCYDQTGASCGAQPCQKGAVVADPDRISFTVPLKATQGDSSLTVLGKVSWIVNKNFPKEIGKYSRTFGSAVAGWQDVVADNPESSVKEYDRRKFHMIVRPHFPVEITVSHAGGTDWVVYLDRADTELEGPRAPIMLEIVGNQWTLISHTMIHADDKGDEKYIVARGSIQ